MPLALRSRFVVGIFEPELHDSWPYFHFDEGLYLSKNKRICSHKSAVEFHSPEQAREFYSSWRHASRYRLSVREFKTRIEVPEPVFPSDHPRSILKRIKAAESSYVYSTALMWFTGSNEFLFSKATLAKHRKLLLPYGIDIHADPDQLLEPLLLDDYIWYLSSPKFSIT